MGAPTRISEQPDRDLHVSLVTCSGAGTYPLLEGIPGKVLLLNLTTAITAGNIGDSYQAVLLFNGQSIASRDESFTGTDQYINIPLGVGDSDTLELQVLSGDVKVTLQWYELTVSMSRILLTDTYQDLIESPAAGFQRNLLLTRSNQYSHPLAPYVFNVDDVTHNVAVRCGTLEQSAYITAAAGGVIDNFYNWVWVLNPGETFEVKLLEAVNTVSPFAFAVWYDSKI